MKHTINKIKIHMTGQKKISVTYVIDNASPLHMNPSEKENTIRK